MVDKSTDLPQENGEADQNTTDMSPPEANNTNIRYGTHLIISLIFILVAWSSLTVITSRQASLSDYQFQISEIHSRLATNLHHLMEIKNKEEYLAQKLEETPKPDSWSYAEPLMRLDVTKIYSTYHLETELKELQDEITSGTIQSKFDVEGVPNLLNIFRTIPSDGLLGILLICSGAIGSIVSSARNPNPRIRRSLTIGMSAGFISLLAIKGGSGLFLSSALGSQVILNPYGIAFFGVLAGLFTELFYEALQSFLRNKLKAIHN